MISLAILTGGRNHILPLLAEDPTWKRTRLKSPQGAATLLVQISKRVLLEEATALILPDIQYWYQDYVKKNGERPNAQSTTSYDEWDEGHDDGLLDLFESFTNVLSASWLNFISTDARIWVEGEDEKLAKSFANEVWKQLTWQRSDNQILAGVGIITEDLAVYGEPTPEPTPVKQVESTPMAVAAILNRIMLSFPDPKDLADNLDMVSDEDDGLAIGAAHRLGITMDDALILRSARMQTATALAWWQSAIETGETLDESKSYVDLEGVEGKANGSITPATQQGTSLDDDGPELPANLKRVPDVPPPPPRATHAGINDPGAPPPPPPPPLPTVNVGSGPATNTGRGGKRTKITATPPPGTVMVDTLRQIKEHTGLRDETLAEMLGLSRPTLANIMKGKGWCVPEAARREAMQTMLRKHIEELKQALGALAVQG